jgi:1,4-alpha-glucan branching enzyme
LFGNPPPKKGSYYPVKTPKGIIVFGRDFYSVQEMEKIANNEVYRDNDRDAGYELESEIVKEFFIQEERQRTGLKYWSRDQSGFYNPQAAHEKINKSAKYFLENTISRLEEASQHMKEAPLIVYAHNADYFGRSWYEGPQFIETLFRMAGGYRDIKFLNPSEYIFMQNLSSFQVVAPEFSSSGINGYSETWLDVSSDWIYRHLFRSMERMTELAERFPDDTGLKERALNQAAREILLAQSSDWPALLYKQDSTEYARKQAENSLRNFTTIYEALGSNYISTEWLTNLERRHNIFPNINYRVFRRKK